MTNELHADRNGFPIISIIIVTLNVAETLQICLDSIYKQSYPSIQIIVLDGGSTDGTIDLLKANDSQIFYWKSEKDSGIYDAMNKALGHKTGDWIYFLGADDELLAAFSEFAYQLKDHSLIYYANVLLGGKKNKGEVTDYQHAKDTICHQAIIYPKEVFDKYQFNTNYKISADHVLNMQCWNNFTFRYVDLVIAYFNDTGVSSVKLDDSFQRDKEKLIYKYYGLITGLRYSFRKFKKMLNPSHY